MYKYFLFITFLLCIAGSASAQYSKKAKAYEQQLEQMKQADEDQQVLIEESRQQRINTQKQKNTQRGYAEEKLRAQQIDDVNHAGWDASDAVTSSGDLQRLLSETETIDLPSLSVFLDAAYEHPSIKREEAKIEEGKAQYIIAKRDWLNYFRLNTTYGYGVGSVLSNSTDINTPLFQTWSGTAQNNWNVGASISISLGNLFTTKQRMNVQRAVMRQAQNDYELAVESRKLTILNAYNSVVEQLATIKAKAEAAAMYEAQMKISENEFINGQITLIALSLERARRTGALVTFQECKVKLHNAITLLELLSNVKILDNKSKLKK